MIVWFSLAGVALIIIFRRNIAEEWNFFQTRRKEWFWDKWKNWGEPFIIAAILAVIIRTFLLGPYKIPTGSMIPTFLIGDRIFVDKVSYRFRGPERGEIIVFKYPLDEKKDFVKRLVGLSGEEIQIKDGKIVINNNQADNEKLSQNYYYNVVNSQYGEPNQIIHVPDDSYFVLGDNSAHSSDSRSWGFVPKKNVVGRAFLIWWPPNRIKLPD